MHKTGSQSANIVCSLLVGKTCKKPASKTCKSTLSKTANNVCGKLAKMFALWVLPKLAKLHKAKLAKSLHGKLAKQHKAKLQKCFGLLGVLGPWPLASTHWQAQGQSVQPCQCVLVPASLYIGQTWSALALGLVCFATVVCCCFAVACFGKAL